MNVIISTNRMTHPNTLIAVKYKLLHMIDFDVWCLTKKAFTKFTVLVKWLWKRDIFFPRIMCIVNVTTNWHVWTLKTYFIVRVSEGTKLCNNRPGASSIYSAEKAHKVWWFHYVGIPTYSYLFIFMIVWPIYDVLFSSYWRNGQRSRF